MTEPRTLAEIGAEYVRAKGARKLAAKNAYEGTEKTITICEALGITQGQLQKWVRDGGWTRRRPRHHPTPVVGKAAAVQGSSGALRRTAAARPDEASP